MRIIYQVRSKIVTDVIQVKIGPKGRMPKPGEVIHIADIHHPEIILATTILTKDNFQAGSGGYTMRVDLRYEPPVPIWHVIPEWKISK